MKKETKSKEDSASFAIAIDEIGLSEGKVSFSDLSLKEPFKTTLSPVEVNVLHFSNQKGKREQQNPASFHFFRIKENS
jgi:hypothetical protein